jgi:hypothetical protein
MYVKSKKKTELIQSYKNYMKIEEKIMNFRLQFALSSSNCVPKTRSLHEKIIL